MSKHGRVLATISTMALASMANAVFATDGVIEINQAKALAGNVTAGDTAGFPVTLNVAGSYRLTSDLDVRVIGLPASANTAAIHMGSGGNFDIDLNGFSIIGPADCLTGSCTNTGTGNGIETPASNSPVNSVRNGKIVGAGSYGLYLPAGTTRVDAVQVQSNGASGMYIGRGVVTRSTATYNGLNGFEIYDASLTDSFASNNLQRAINLENGTIADCSVEGANGVIRIAYGNIHGTYVKANAGAALVCDFQCALFDNKFIGCTGAACITGAGSMLEVPPASNMCGAEDCIP